MKTTLLDKIAIALFFALLTMATLCFGVKSKDSLSAHMHTGTTPYELVAFKVQPLNNRNYINWSVISAHGNHYFALERSFDGENYSVIQLKRGFASPKGQKLQYSFIDEETSSSERTYYRIKLHEVQAMDTNHKKAILSPENMFEKNALASVVINNTKKTTSQLTKK